MRNCCGLGEPLGARHRLGVKSIVMSRARSPLRRLSGLLLAATALTAGAAMAEIQVRTLADGSTIISNESSAQRARRQSSSLLPVPDKRIEHTIGYYARQQGLSPQLVQAVIQVESGYNVRALSSKGAMGLMQLMPETAAELRVRDAYDADQNIRGGTLYLRRMLDHFGDLTLALAAYNAGPTAVTRHGGVPPYKETERYVEKVLGLYHGKAPDEVRQEARWAAQRRAREAQRERRETGESGERVYMTRDENNQIVFTTKPPKPE